MIALRKITIRTFRPADITAYNQSPGGRELLNKVNPDHYYNCITAQYDGELRVNVDSLARVAEIDPQYIVSELGMAGIEITELQVEDQQQYLVELQKSDPDQFQKQLIQLWLGLGQTFYPLENDIPLVFVREEQGLSGRTDEPLTLIQAKYLPKGMTFMVDPPTCGAPIGFAHIRRHSYMSYGFGYDEEIFTNNTPVGLEVWDAFRGRFRGTGRALVILALHLAKALGERTFSVSTSRIEKFYLGLGFIKQDQENLYFDLNDPIPPILIEPRR